VTREFEAVIIDESCNRLSGLTAKTDGRTFISDEDGMVAFSLIFDDTKVGFAHTPI